MISLVVSLVADVTQGFSAPLPGSDRDVQERHQAGGPAVGWDGWDTPTGSDQKNPGNPFFKAGGSPTRAASHFKVGGGGCLIYLKQ